MHATKQHLLEAGLKMLLERGYNDLGVQALLDATNTPKGSFYHHFESKEDFAMQVVDLYMIEVHKGLAEFLSNKNVPPLARVRGFFEATREKYRADGHLGCMLGGMGQELSGVSESFAKKIDACFDSIGDQIAACLAEAQRQGDLPANADPRRLAKLLVNCWEGAALRSRLQRRADPLDEMLDFYFGVAIRT